MLFINKLPVSCCHSNNSGAPLQTRYTETVTIKNTVFMDNMNNATAPNDKNETSIEDLYNIVQTSGGVTIFINDQSATVVIDNCTFSNNHASMNQPNDTRPVLLKQNGHGGSLLLRLSGSYESSVMITGCTFTGNTAEVDGGAVYLTYSDGSQNNSFYFYNNTFFNNTVSEASGVCGLH